MNRRKLYQKAGGKNEEFRLFKTYEDLNRYLLVNRNNVFPIFSQKRGICAPDASMIICWLAEGLRDVFWQLEVDFEESPARYSTCVVAQIKQFFNPATSKEICAESTNDYSNKNIRYRDISQLLVKLSLHRLVRIWSSDPFIPVETSETTTITRTSSQPLPGVSIPTGEVCANLFHLFDTLKVNESNESKVLYIHNNNADDYILTKNPSAGKDEYGTTTYNRPKVLLMLFETYGISDRFIIKKHADYQGVVGNKTIAFDISAKIPGTASSHATSCVLIGDTWHYCDNEIGISIPLVRVDKNNFITTPLGTGALVEGIFKYTFTKKNDVYKINIVLERFDPNGMTGDILYESLDYEVPMAFISNKDSILNQEFIQDRQRSFVVIDTKPAENNLSNYPLENPTNKKLNVLFSTADFPATAPAPAPAPAKAQQQPQKDAKREKKGAPASTPWYIPPPAKAQQQQVTIPASEQQNTTSSSSSSSSSKLPPPTVQDRISFLLTIQRFYDLNTAQQQELNMLRMMLVLEQLSYNEKMRRLAQLRPKAAIGALTDTEQIEYNLLLEYEKEI